MSSHASGLSHPRGHYDGSQNISESFARILLCFVSFSLTNYSDLYIMRSLLLLLRLQISEELVTLLLLRFQVSGEFVVVVVNDVKLVKSLLLLSRCQVKSLLLLL